MCSSRLDFWGLDLWELEEGWAASLGEVPSQIGQGILDSSNSSDIDHLMENFRASVVSSRPGLEFFAPCKYLPVGLSGSFPL